MLWDNQVCVVTSLSTLIIVNSQSQHSNSETIHVHVRICALVSCGVERRVSILLGPFQSGIDLGFCLSLLQSFVCSWPRHLCGMHGFHPNLGMIGCQVLSFEPLDGGVSRTWTDANWIWHSLTNSGTIYDWCQIDTEIWVGSDYNYWPILGLGFQQQIVNQCVGPPDLVTKARG